MVSNLAHCLRWFELVLFITTQKLIHYTFCHFIILIVLVAKDVHNTSRTNSPDSIQKMNMRSCFIHNLGAFVFFHCFVCSKLFVVRNVRMFIADYTIFICCFVLFFFSCGCFIKTVISTISILNHPIQIQFQMICTCLMDIFFRSSWGIELNYSTACNKQNTAIWLRGSLYKRESLLFVEQPTQILLVSLFTYWWRWRFNLPTVYQY